MPLPGGASDKIGNRYEARWVADRILDVLEGKFDIMRLEPPGSEEKGFEFYLRNENKLEYHQVKRQHSGRGHWSLGDLAQASVLEHFWQKLSEPSPECVFVSTQAASELQELADRARDAASFTEFQKEFLKSKELAAQFAELRRHWTNASEQETYEKLKRVRTEAVSESYLRTVVESRLGAQVVGDPSAACAILFQFAFDSVHKEISAHDLWRVLTERGFERRQWQSDPSILARIEETNSRYLSPPEGDSIRGTVIPRDAVTGIVDQLASASPRKAVMVTGGAGIGKSVVMRQVVRDLQNAGAPALALRVDRLDPTPLPGNIGEQIGLPGSPALVLAAVAPQRHCVLVIDQLDAVSKVSGRNPQFYDCVHQIIQQAQAFPEMKLLLACRKFDLANDERFRELTSERGIAQEVTVGPFSADQVRQVVGGLGLDGSRLTANQVQLLSVPLHLSLLAGIADGATGDVLDFQTLDGLYDHFWRHKQDRVKERRGGVSRWTEVINLLCEEMSRSQQLAVPLVRLDDCREDVEAMASEHVLVIDQQRCSFFHESFFDYAFARRFAARGRSLVQFLLENSQDLFRRAQVRQLLQFLRGADNRQYLAEVESLLTDPCIRFHLKWVIFAWLGQLAGPTTEEWAVLRRLLEKPITDAEALRIQVMNLLRKSPAWFSIAYREGDLARWLADQKDEVVNELISTLPARSRDHAEAVASLLDSHFGESDSWTQRIQWVLSLSQVDHDRKLFELFLKLIDLGAFDKQRGSAGIGRFWSHLYDLSTRRQDWASEALGRVLQRSWQAVRGAGESDPFDSSHATIPSAGYDDEATTRAYQGAPVEFLAHTFSFVLEVSAANVLGATEQLDRDKIWRWRHYYGGHNLQSWILKGVEHSLRHLATNEPHAFREIAARLRATNLETAHFLLVRGYAANGQEFADEAADYLIEDPARLALGYMDAPYYASADLIRAASPYCSHGKLRALEERLLSYYPRFEKTPGGGRYYGHAQFELLSAFDVRRRSPAGQRRLQELEHKFGPAQVSEPSPTACGAVPSPVPEAALHKMTDEQWLRALARYKTDGATLKNAELIGGAIELSRGLEREVQSNPQRFAGLLRRFPLDAHQYYFCAVIRGLCESNAGMTTILVACQYVHELPGRPAGREICDCFANNAGADWPESALAMVSWYATEDPDPERESWRPGGSGQPVYYGGDIVNAGLNSVRGGAARAIAILSGARLDRLGFFRATIERMLEDPSIAVRSWVATVLLQVLRVDADLAVEWFLRLCQAEDPLLGTHYVERFLHYAVRNHFKAVEQLLHRMITSTDAEARAAGARQIAIGALATKDAQALVESCLYGGTELRTGIAEISAANVTSASYREFCSNILGQLFHDSEEQVRSKAAGCFRQFEKEELGQAEELASAFVGSPAFVHDCHSLLRALDQTTAKLPGPTFAACRRFIDVFGAEASSFATKASFDATIVSRLIVRAYAQAEEPELRSRCLDLIDRMSALGTLELAESLQAYER
jgi:hypothetical protein